MSINISKTRNISKELGNCMQIRTNLKTRFLRSNSTKKWKKGIKTYTGKTEMVKKHVIIIQQNWYCVKSDTQTSALICWLFGFYLLSSKHASLNMSITSVSYLGQRNTESTYNLTTYELLKQEKYLTDANWTTSTQISRLNCNKWRNTSLYNRIQTFVIILLINLHSLYLKFLFRWLEVITEQLKNRCLFYTISNHIFWMQSCNT